MIVVNRIQCNNCKDIIQSLHRHDFKMCSCEGCGVDGGISYLRRIGGNYKDVSLYNTDDISKIREHFTWGKNFDEHNNLLGKTEWVKIKDITDSHLDALIIYWQERLEIYKEAEIFLDIFKREKEYRNGEKLHD